MDKTREIKEALEKLSPTAQRVAEDYIRIRVERDALARLVKDFEQQHNELYMLLIAILQHNDKKIEIPKEAFHALHFSEYKVEWIDVGDNMRIILRHFTDEQTG